MINRRVEVPHGPGPQKIAVYVRDAGRSRESAWTTIFQYVESRIYWPFGEQKIEVRQASKTFKFSVKFA